VHARHEHVTLRKHKRLPEPKTSSHEHTTITYYSGSGGVLQTRTKIEGSRYRAGGQQHIGNKGHAVRTFDPSEGGPGYAVVTGDPVKTVRHDDLGRPIRVEYRDGSVERTEFDAWGQVSFDRNDTAQDEGYEGDLDAREKADLALHAGTGKHVRFDVLGRAYASFAELRDDTQRQMVSSRTHFDAAGNAFETIDAAGRVAEKRRFGLGGLQLSARSVDGGVSASLPNVDGSVLYARRGPLGEGYGTYSSHDALRRPVSDFIVSDTDGTSAVVKHRVWVDEAPEVDPGEAVNGSTYHKGRLLRVYDGGGMQAFFDYDHRGAVERTERVLPADPTGRPDWTVLVGCRSVVELDDAAAGLLETQRRFESSAQFDANGRLVQSQNPHGTRTFHEYTEEGQLKRVSRARQGGGAEVILEVEGYDIFGRPTATTRGKVRTAYAYDPTTQRLTSVTSKAGSKALQGLSYVYAPAGGVLRIRDDAHKAVTVGGEVVEPVSRYRYDTLGRLVEASGREHHGQLPGQGGRGPMDAAVARVAAPNDVTAVRSYTQRYRYDVHGNILELRHQLAARHSADAWTRRSQYSEFGNRLRASAVGATDTPERFEHDAFGRMQMPHLDAMVWDELDQLRSVRRGTTEVFFQYVDGQRVRKWTVKGGRTEERVYVGGVEEFRAFVGSDPFDEDKVDEQTHTEHAPGGLTLDVKLRRDRKAVAKPKALYRYRLGNHLGSTSLEVDEDGGVVSYEEFHPYGTTAYRAVRSGIDVDVNRYRFTGMEKDEETGLAQHGWRYFASWLGRWCSADPIGLGDGLNRYAYCGGDPVNLADTEGASGYCTLSEHCAYAYEGESYIDFSDSEVGPSITPHGRDFDGDPITSLAVPNADPSWVVDPYIASANSSEYISRGLERDIHGTQAAGAAGMVIYAAILFGSPFIIEGALVFGAFASGAGASPLGLSTATWLTGQHLSAGVGTYLAGSAFARGIVTLGGIAEQADSVANGEPLGVVDVPLRRGGRFGLPSSRRRRVIDLSSSGSPRSLVSGPGAARALPPASGQRGGKAVPLGTNSGVNVLPNSGAAIPLPPKVPGNRGGAFTRWFDSLSPDELDWMWSHPRVRETIESRIRSPGGKHEWLMAARAPTFHKMGVSMADIRTLRTRTGDVLLQRGAETGVHGGNLSGRMHYELRALIDSSRNFSDYRNRMQRFARRWLPGGVADLPEGLRP
ncbi:MAG: RHS repeat-associated core domain-containing protein, partial [bacterium]|nr:RHS repeat-associated core domain-containing protein [bacterium]